MTDLDTRIRAIFARYAIGGEIIDQARLLAGEEAASRALEMQQAIDPHLPEAVAAIHTLIEEVIGDDDLIIDYDNDASEEVRRKSEIREWSNHEAETRNELRAAQRSRLTNQGDNT